jgi:hypothetical protein
MAVTSFFSYAFITCLLANRGIVGERRGAGASALPGLRSR